MQIQLNTAEQLASECNPAMNCDILEQQIPAPGENQPQIADRIYMKDLEHGPYDESKRQCHDIFWFFFFWMNTLAMIVLSAWAYFTGTPNNIFRSTDQFKNACGKRNTSFQKYRFVYFYNLATYDTSKRVCLEKCPRLQSDGYTFSCNSDGPACVPNITVEKNGTTTQTIQKNEKYFMAFESQQRIDRICLPSSNTLKNVLRPYAQILANGLIQSQLLDFISDVQNNYGWLFAMGGVAIALSVTFWLGLRFFPVISIWFSLTLAIIIFLLIGLVFLYNGGALTVNDEQGKLGIPTSQDRYFYSIYGAFCLVFTLIAIFVFVCCYHQLGPTVEMLKISSKFFSQIPTSLMVVLMMTVMMYLFWMTAISSMAYALSASEFKATGKVFTQITGKMDRGLIMFYYFLFNTFWTHEIFISTMVFAVSNVTAKWYFHNGPVQELQKPMWKTLMMIMRFLYGSLAFGSLVLLLVQFLELFIQLIFFFHSWKYHNKNQCFKVIDNCLQALSSLIFKITSRMNRFAYIQIAMRGKNFIQASNDGYQLLKLDQHRYRLLFTVESVLFFMLRLGVALITTTIFYLFASFAQFAETNIMQPIYFVLLIFYFSLGMASVILGSYSSCIETLITCYVVDEFNQREKQNGKPLYAPIQMVELFRFVR